MERDDRQRIGDPDGVRKELHRAAGELPAEPMRFLEEQYEAMRRSLERYLDERFHDLRSGHIDQGSAVAAQGRLGRVGQLFVRFRPEFYLLVTLAVVAFLWFAGEPRSREAGPDPNLDQAQGRAGVAGGSREPVAEGAAAPSLLGAETLAGVREDPSGAWRRMVESDRERLASWLRAVAEARGLEPSRVSEKQQRRFAQYSEAVSGSGDLPDELLSYARIGLFEYTYGLFEQTRQGANSQGFRVTLDFTGYDPTLLRTLLEEQNLAESLPEELDPRDPVLQVAFLGRRLAGELPEAGE